VFLIAFALAAALAMIPAFAHDSLQTIYARTVTYQANRESPFSVWGLYKGLATPQRLVQGAAVLLALALALPRRGRDVGGLAAACAAVVLAVQLGVSHWFYLYIPWFYGLVVLALFASFSPPRSSRRGGGASGSALSTPRGAVLSSG
jgi:hypothetical protein